MDAPAIREIQLAQQIINANFTLNAAIEGPHQSVYALHKDFSLENLEKFEPQRSRFRGKFTTAEPDAFAAYAKNKAAENPSCFINANQMTATLIFNIGTDENPGHCDDKAQLGLEMTAPYKALLSIVNKRLEQKDVAEFIEDWRQIVGASSDFDIDGIANTIPLAKAIHAIRKITIEQKATTESESRNFGATNTSMDSIDVKSADMPPAFLHFTCQPFLGLAERKFDLRLSVITDRQPALVLRIVRHETIQEEIANEFQQLINTKLAEIEPTIKTFIGDFSP